MNRLLPIITLALCSLAVGGSAGCDTKPAPARAVALSKPQSADESLVVVKRTEFENWSQFPIGTSVTKSREISKADEKTMQTTIYRLVSKDDQHVVVESTVSLLRDGHTQNNEPTTLDYPATFRVPADMNVEQFSLPSPSAKSSGTESIEVLGKTYEATVYKWQSQAEAGPVDNTLWMSNEIPGRSLKHQSNCVGTITEEVITKLEIPAVASGS